MRVLIGDAQRAILLDIAANDDESPAEMRRAALDLEAFAEDFGHVPSMAFACRDARRRSHALLGGLGHRREA